MSSLVRTSNGGLEMRDMKVKVINLNVETQDDLTQAAGLLAVISTHRRMLEAEKKDLTAPLREQVKSINDNYREMLADLSNAETVLKSKMGAAKRALETQRKALAEAANKANAAGDGQGARQALSLAAKMNGHVAGVHERDTWSYEITDLTAVPREFLTINTAALNAYIRKHKDEKAIPGVRVFKKTTLVQRSGGNG